MFLKSIEIFGFKSFHKKVKLNFHKGINCIVGPNGCGKSNIIDALRWTLGETNSSILRCETLEDIIFHGTKTKHRVGIADVRLIIENNNGSEIEITKKITRGGSTECFINRKTVRQRDITDLFLDTGTYAYALMERTVIDKLLSEGASNMRRKLIEELAGIGGYRENRAHTLSKLERLSIDTERLDTLISEIEETERTLSLQVKRAKRYNKLKQVLKDMKSVIYARKKKLLQEKEDKLNTLHQRKNIVEKEKEELEQEIRNLYMEKDLKDAREKVQQREKNVATFKERKTALLEWKKEVETKVQSLKPEIPNFREKIELLEQEEKKLKEKGYKGKPACQRTCSADRFDNKELETMKRKEVELSMITKESEKINEEEQRLLTQLQDKEELLNSLKFTDSQKLRQLRETLQTNEQKRLLAQTYLSSISRDLPYPVVSDVMNIKQGFEVPVMSALEDTISTFVVQKTEQALEIMKGVRTSAISLQLVCRGLINQTPTNGTTLSDFVEWQKGYEKMRGFLCNYILVNDINSALKLRKDFKPACQSEAAGRDLFFVTKQGIVLTPQGVIRGGKFEKARLSRERVAEQLETIETEINKLKENIHSMEENEKSITKQRANLEASIAIIKNNLKQLKNKKREYDQKGNLEQIRREIKEREQTKTFVMRLTTIKEEKNRLNSYLEEKRLTIAGEVEKNRELEGKIYDISRRLKQEEKHLTAEKEILATLEKGIRNTQSTIDKKLKNVKDEHLSLSQNIEEIKEETGRIKAYLEFLESEGIDIGSPQSTVDSRRTFPVDYRLWTVDFTAQEIEKSEDRIKHLEPINLLAIDQHKEVKERLDSLIEGRDDLIRAREITEQTIRTLDKSSAERFRAGLEDANREFSAVFSSLFNGGECSLILRDTRLPSVGQGNPLETTLDIVASPGGKSMKRIELLSTGEKALTVIALLFGIYNLKPTPFVILDEVDAPLDDANIQRFVKLIQDRTKDSQFIIITHNKKTMEIADYLYGVTMAEPGVSKIVSVQMR